MENEIPHLCRKIESTLRLWYMAVQNTSYKRLDLEDK